MASKEYNQAYYAANKEKRLANWRAWYIKNKEKAQEQGRARYYADRDKKRAQSKAWKQNNKARVKTYLRERNLKQYGLTPEEFSELLAAQDNKCAICLRTKPTKNGWAVDHIHRSGYVRGILCNPCNLMLGLARDSGQVLYRASVYVDAYDAIDRS